MNVQQVVMQPAQPGVVMVPVAQSYVLTQGGGDRTKKQNGATALQNKANITIFYNAELKDVSCCTKLALCCMCQKYDLERSYLYLRENSIESNVASTSLCCGEACDNVTVTYFDRKPYKPFNMCICCCKSNPKLEITKPGCEVQEHSGEKPENPSYPDENFASFAILDAILHGSR